MFDTITVAGPSVLAATPDTVILRGRQWAGSEPVDCVVHVTRKLYLEAIVAWLDEKADYFKTFNEHSGGGIIEFEGLTRRRDGVRLQTAEGVHIVLVYDAAYFVVDMQRG